MGPPFRAVGSGCELTSNGELTFSNGEQKAEGKGRLSRVGRQGEFIGCMEGKSKVPMRSEA